MNDKQWEILGDLLGRIAHLEGTWEDKRDELLAAAVKFGFRDNLVEIATWIAYE